jgi:hypothetical protein
MMDAWCLVRRDPIQVRTQRSTARDLVMWIEEVARIRKIAQAADVRGGTKGNSSRSGGRTRHATDALALASCCGAGLYWTGRMDALMWLL